MTDAVNHQFKLASRPDGMVTAENFEYVESPVPEPGDGEVLVKVQYLSLDPAMRGWMNEGRSYIPPVGIGEVMRAGGVGRWSRPSTRTSRRATSRHRRVRRAGVRGRPTATACTKVDTRPRLRCRSTSARSACRA